jgi:hypothetical protein
VGGAKNERLVLRAPDGEVAGTASFSVRTRSGGVNRAGFVLDSKHAQIAEIFFQSVLSKMQALSPGHRIEINLTDWQAALVRAAEKSGCSKRLSAYRMGLKFTENG